MLEGMLNTGAARSGETRGNSGRPRRPLTPEALRRDRLARLSALSLARAGRPLQTDPETAAEATAVARAWLELVDAGRYAVSWTATSPALQDAICRDDWHTALRSARAPLGRCFSRHLVARSIVEAPSRTPKGPWAVMRFEGRFEQRLGVVETVAASRDGNGRWRVAAYFIR